MCPSVYCAPPAAAALFWLCPCASRLRAFLWSSQATHPSSLNRILNPTSASYTVAECSVLAAAAPSKLTAATPANIRTAAPKASVIPGTTPMALVAEDEKPFVLRLPHKETLPSSLETPTLEEENQQQEPKASAPTVTEKAAAQTGKEGTQIASSACKAQRPLVRLSNCCFRGSFTVLRLYIPTCCCWLYSGAGARAHRNCNYPCSAIPSRTPATAEAEDTSATPRAGTTAAAAS